MMPGLHLSYLHRQSLGCITGPAHVRSVRAQVGETQEKTEHRHGSVRKDDY